MLYLANPSTPAVRDAMRRGRIGAITQPGQHNTLPAGVPWCADNGCFADNFNQDSWWAWLRKLDPTGCVFAVAPDVVADAHATHNRSLAWLPRIRALGLPAAYVAQDGTDRCEPPWPAFDALFIGGTTGYKLGPEPRRLAKLAKQHRKWLHMGRVNSQRRYTYARHLQCDSVDGTYLTYGPDTNLPNLIAWTRTLNQHTLWDHT